jgi:hypothetical protein
MMQLHVSRFKVPSNPDMTVPKEGIEEWFVLLVVTISMMPFCMFKRFFPFLGWRFVEKRKAGKG